MNISLRGYNKLIEDLVEKSQIEEAVAHCRHILKEYPNHIDTRRTLAGAYLDARKYAMAKDLFQEVLLALPADFVSNLGMSFIYSMEGDIGYAIWHMERAFEKNPNNLGIQDELKKLYTLRDGVAPERINKTNGVLAYLYFNSGEYDQAEQTIQEILQMDVTRREMKTLLARIHFMKGDYERSMETCLECFAHSTHNFEANRLMIKILQKINSIQNLDVYRQRLKEMDPYSIHPETLLLAEELFVPEDAIQVGKLEWTPDTFNWSEEGETNLQNQTGADPTDDLTNTPTDPLSNQVDDAVNPLLESAESTEQIEEIVAETPIVEEFPDWLKDLMQPEQGVIPASDDTIPDWVMEIEPDPEPVEPLVGGAAMAAIMIDENTVEEDGRKDSPAESMEEPDRASPFNLADWTDSVDLLDDPEVESAVAKALNDIPTEEELELLAETKPTIFSFRISTNQDGSDEYTKVAESEPSLSTEQNITSLSEVETEDEVETLGVITEVSPLDEKIEPVEEPDFLAKAEPMVEEGSLVEPDPVAMEESVTEIEDLAKPEEQSIPEITESQEDEPATDGDLPNYEELDWLGDLGKHQAEQEPDPLSGEPQISALQIPEIVSESGESDWLGELTPPTEVEDTSPIVVQSEIPEISHPIPPLHLPDMPNVELPEHIRSMHTAALAAEPSSVAAEEPIEEITSDELQETSGQGNPLIQPTEFDSDIPAVENENKPESDPDTQPNDIIQGSLDDSTSSTEDSELASTSDETELEMPTDQEFQELSNIDSPWKPLGSVEMPGTITPPREEYDEVIEEIIPEEETSLPETPAISPWMPVEQHRSGALEGSGDDPAAVVNPTVANLDGLELIDDPSVLFNEEDTTEEEPLMIDPEPVLEGTSQVEEQLADDLAVGGSVDPKDLPLEEFLTEEGDDEPAPAVLTDEILQSKEQPEPLENPTSVEGPEVTEETGATQDNTSTTGEPELLLNPADSGMVHEQDIQPETVVDEPTPDPSQGDGDGVVEPDLSVREELTPGPDPADESDPTDEPFEAINLQSEDLASAASQLTKGNLDAALDEFSALIKQEAHLPEVISHLENLLKQHPTNKKAWRTLGDAHFNANHLQDALDAYSRADGLMDAE